MGTKYVFLVDQKALFLSKLRNIFCMPEVAVSLHGIAVYSTNSRCDLVIDMIGEISARTRDQTFQNHQWFLMQR